jgi:hypothetical protein
MLNRRALVPGFALAAVAFLGACADAPTEPVDMTGDDDVVAAPQTNLIYGGSRDHIYAAIADEVPGFGGLFYDDTGALNLYMTDSPLTDAAAIAALGPRVGVFGIDMASEHVNVLPATYTFAELNAMRSKADAVLGLDGVVFTDADEAINRVTIAVENNRVMRNVQRSLAMAGVPAAAVNYVIMDPIVPMQTLQDRVRPVAGGLQINFPGFLCTLGAPVREADGTLGWITNSHCTNQQWNMTGTPYGQPSGSFAASPNFIGFEVADPPGFTGGICPAGRVCRYSDASKGHFSGAAIILPGEVGFGRVYQTMADNQGTAVLGRTINAANPFFNIVAERPFPNVGQTIHKVGRTTGWSNGVVTHSCINTGVGGTNFTLFCQEVVQRPGVAIVGGGDSGSSVWDKAPRGGPNDVRIHGLLWGGSGSSLFVFSAMNEIRLDHGFPAWVTH